MAALCEYWSKSGIPRLSDDSITKQILRLHDEWRVLCKNKMKKSSVEAAKREAFENKLVKLFDIASPDAIDILNSDRLRTTEAGKADIEFYLDQKGARIGTMSGLDKVHKEAVDKKKKRIDNESRRKDDSFLVEKGGDKDSVLELDDTEEINNNLDKDFVAPVGRKVKKPEVVPLLVPRRITETVALNCKRWKISDVASTSSLALVIQESGGNLDDFVLSKSTSRRQGAKAVTKDALNIK